MVKRRRFHALPYVDARAEQTALLQGIEHRRLVEYAASCHVDENCSRFHQRDFTPAYHMAGLVGKRSVHSENVGTPQQFVEVRDALVRNVGPAIRGHIGIVAEDFLAHGFFVVPE